MDANASREDFDFSQYLAVFFRRKWIIIAVFLTFIGGAFAYLSRAIPIYSASTLLLIDKEERLSGVYSKAQLVESSSVDYYQTQFHLIKSRGILKKIYEDLNLAGVDEFSAGYKTLLGVIEVSPLRGSRLIHIKVDSIDPELAAAISNKIAEVYVAQNLENKLFISKDILKTLNRDFDPTRSLDESYYSLPAVVNNVLIQKLKAQAAGLDIKWGELSSRYTPDHPERKRLSAQRRALDARIHLETVRAVKGMQAELSGKLLGNNVRIIDPAEIPVAPSWPNKRIILGGAAVFGLVLGFMTAWGIDTMDQSIHTQEDVELMLGMPFLGGISRADALAGETARELHELLSGANSFTGEAFKNIRTMIGLAAAGKSIKNILITSTVQSEGKTFLSINLALVFSQLGKRVLLIEGDLRRPNLHKRFGLSNEVGLSHYLAHGGDSSELPGLIQDSGLSGLKVLVCGHIPPNPSELLSTPRLQDLLKWVAKEYDHVIVDGTPVFPITDALLWSKEVDAVVFIIKFSGVHAGLALKAKQKLLETGVKISGAIVNQVTWRGKSYYGDYYYRYHYSSHYTDEKKKQKV